MQKSKSLLILDVNNLPLASDSFRVLWQSYATANTDKEISIPQLVENNADRLRSKYLALIYDLGELNVNGKTVVENLKINQVFSYWWMTLLNEKCNYTKSPQIDNIIKLLAFEDWIKTKSYNDIKLVSNNFELAESVRLLLIDLGVNFYWEKEKIEKFNVKLFRIFFNKLPAPIRAIISFTKYIISRWKLKGVGVSAWKKSSATLLFTSYFFNLTPDSVKEGKYKSRFWSILPNLLNNKNIQSNWLHLYVENRLVPSVSSAKVLIKKFNENNYNQNHVFLDSFLTFGVVNSTIMSWIGQIAKNRKIERAIKKQARFLWPLMDKDVNESLFGAVMIRNILSYFLFREAMQHLPTQKIGCYLQENQGWEFGFVSAWKEFKHSEIIGIQHSTVRYWDLRYFFDTRLYNRKNQLSIPLPDKIGVNGEVAKSKYIAGGYPIKKLINVEALRYLELEEKNTLNMSTIKELFKAENVQVLILGDYLHENNVRMMQLLQDANLLVKNKIKYIVKPHPACQIISADYPGLDIVVSGGSISELIGQCVVAYTSSVTSAAVDVYCFGRSVITLLDATKLNLSPLRGYNELFLVETADELSIILSNIENLTMKNQHGDDYFYLDSELPKWTTLLSENNKIRQTNS